MGFPGCTSDKEPTCQCKRHGFNPQVGKIPWRGAWQPTQVVLSGESHGQRSLASYSPQGHTESDTTKVIQHTHTLCVCVMCNNSKLLTCIKSFNTRATPRFGCYYYYFTEEDLRCREVNQVAQGHSVIRYEPRWFVLLGVSLFTTCQFIAGL